MQISKIVLYHSDGEKRILEFNLGEVNIITGDSKTGKTALIDIVNYCLGSPDCNVAAGFIKDNVKWFSTIFKIKSKEFFIARVNPDTIGQISTKDIFYTTSRNIQIPEIAELIPNSNIDVLKSIWEEELGIGNYKNKPEQKTRDDLKVSFKHSKNFCFQPQDLIAQRNDIFFNQNSENGSFVKQAIIDTLPYFLGSVEEDTIEIEQLIAEKKRQLRQAKRQFESFQNIKEKGRKELFDYIEISKEVGLINTYTEVNSEVEAFLILEKIKDWVSEENDNGGYSERISTLIEQKSDHKIKIDELDIELHSLRSF